MPQLIAKTPFARYAVYGNFNNGGNVFLRAFLCAVSLHSAVF